MQLSGIEINNGYFFYGHTRHACASKGLIALYDLSGRRLKMLVSEFASGGMHVLTITGEGLSQGVYLLKFQVNDELIVKKVVME